MSYPYTAAETLVYDRLMLAKRMAPCPLRAARRLRWARRRDGLRQIAMFWAAARLARTIPKTPRK